jgi:hypothetical protein
MSNEMRKGLTKATLPQTGKKVSVTLQLDADILKWFKKEGYGTNHINKTLRTYMEHQTKQQLKLKDIKKVKQLLITKKCEPVPQ